MRLFKFLNNNASSVRMLLVANSHNEPTKELIADQTTCNVCDSGKFDDCGACKSDVYDISKSEMCYCDSLNSDPEKLKEKARQRRRKQREMTAISSHAKKQNFDQEFVGNKLEEFYAGESSQLHKQNRDICLQRNQGDVDSGDVSGNESYENDLFDTVAVEDRAAFCVERNESIGVERHLNMVVEHPVTSESLPHAMAIEDHLDCATEHQENAVIVQDDTINVEHFLTTNYLSIHASQCRYSKSHCSICKKRISELKLTSNNEEELKAAANVEEEDYVPDKYLIYTMGQLTYTPHQVAIKRIRMRRCNGGEDRLIPDVPVSDLGIGEDKFDMPDCVIEMHGHITGMHLSPDEK